MSYLAPTVQTQQMGKKKYNTYAALCFSLFSALILLNEEKADLNVTLPSAWKLWPTLSSVALKNAKKTPFLLIL